MSKFSINTVYIWHRKWWPHLISHYLIQSLAQEQVLGLFYEKFCSLFGLRKSIFLLVHIFVRSCACTQRALMIIHHPWAGKVCHMAQWAPRVCGLFHARANSVTFCFLFNLALLLFLKILTDHRATHCFGLYVSFLSPKNYSVANLEQKKSHVFFAVQDST